MEKGIKKISYKVLTLVLCLCIVTGAAAPAYATAGPYDQGIYNNTLNIMQYTSSSNTFLSNIYTLLSQFKTNFDSFSASWNTSTFLPNSLLNNINSTITTLNNNFVNNTHDYSSTLTNIYNTLVVARSDLYSIDSNVDNIYTWVMAIGQALSGIQTDVSGIKTDTANLSGIKTDTANLSGIKTDTAYLSGIKTDLETFNSDYNDINWNIAGNVTGVFNGDGSSLTSSSVNNVSTTFLLNSALGNIYYMVLPFANDVFTNTDPKYEIGLIRSGVYQPINDAVVISALYNVSSTTVIFYIPNNYPVGTYNYYIKATTNKRFWVTQSIINSYPNVYGISKDKKDFYDVASWVDLDNIYKLFKQAKQVFFDDKTIAAKKANEANEDAVLTNFTGSGTASATPSDFGAVKDSIVDLKAGFTGGASSSDTFSFLSGDSNAWDWFSQDNANDVDRTQGNNTRLLRSSSDVASDTPLLDSYYTSILSILGGD